MFVRWVSGGGGWVTVRVDVRAHTIESMRTYMPEWTKMSLHQHTTVLHTGCVWVCEWVDVCVRVSLGLQYLRCMSGYECATVIG